MCKQTLKDVDHSKEIKNLKKEINTLSDTIDIENKTLISLEEEVENLTTKKIIFDEYEKEILKKERLMLEVEKKNLEINGLNTKLEKWAENKEKLENNTEIDKKILTLNSTIDILNNTKDRLVREIESNKSTIENGEINVKDRLDKN